MSKSQIIILVSVFLIIVASIILVFIVIPNIDSNDDFKGDSNIDSNVLKIGNYTLKYGLYEGYETEYDHDLEKVIETKKELILLDDENIKMEEKIYPFSVKENKLYVYGTEYFEVTANNKLTLVLGGGIDYEWTRENK